MMFDVVKVFGMGFLAGGLTTLVILLQPWRRK
jgi:hypothetical protein